MSVQSKPIDHAAMIERQRDELIAGIRRALIEPVDAVISTIDRIASRRYPPETAQHVAEELGELAREIGEKFSLDSRAIRRLGTGLYQFEKRLLARRSGG
jgi:hypothetical protein